MSFYLASGEPKGDRKGRVVLVWSRGREEDGGRQARKR